MSAFAYADGSLCCAGHRLCDLADVHGTPTYFYSADAIRERIDAFRRAFLPLGAHLRYAVKASGNLSVLRAIARQGAGADVVSGGELERAWLAGFPMQDIVFAGVGKTDREIRAALDGSHSPLLSRDKAPDGIERSLDPAGRGCVGVFNVESESELRRVDALGRELGVRPRCALRLNPDVDALTHAHTSTGGAQHKFGMDTTTTARLYAEFSRPADDGRGASVVGLHVHIGSPVNRTGPFVEAAGKLVSLARRLRDDGCHVDLLNIGGGWGFAYAGEQVPTLDAYADALAPVLSEEVARGTEILIEPGRSIVAGAGVLVVRVVHVKRTTAKTFVICDAGMNALLRPAMYEAQHLIWPAEPPGDCGTPRICRSTESGLEMVDIVGPLCESSDYLAKGRAVPPVQPGDLLAVFDAGAYGMSMSSNYNDHPRPAEVIMDGDKARLVRRRQPLEMLLDDELGLASGD